MGEPIDKEWDGCVIQLDVGPTLWPWTLTSPMTLTLDFFKVKFSNSPISGMEEIIDMEWNGCESIACWIHYLALNFDLSQNLDIEFLYAI